MIRDYSARYAENWGIISLRTRRLAKWRCCYPGCDRRSTETHHSVYRDKDGLVRGREVPGVHVFPLCDKHHKIAHRRRHWIRDRKNPETDSRNTPEFYRLLRQGWVAIVHPNKKNFRILASPVSSIRRFVP